MNPPGPPRTVPSMTTKHSIQRMLVHAFLGLVAVQFFLAGLGVFRNNPKPDEKIIESSTFDPHRIVGDVLTLISLLILVMAFVAKRETRLSATLFGLMIVQQLLAGLGEDTPVLGGLHALNGVAITAVAAVLLLRLRPASRPAAAPAG